MAVNVSVQYYGDLLPVIILTTQCYMLLPSGNPFKYHEGLIFAAYDPTRYLISVSTVSPLLEGAQEGLDAFRFSLNNNNTEGLDAFRFSL